MIEDFDRIYSLGFMITIDWNICFSIYYIDTDSDISTNILICSYHESWSPSITFEDVIESSCDIFYEWYNKNMNNININISRVDSDIVLGDITKRVKRNLNLDKLL